MSYYIEGFLQINEYANTMQFNVLGHNTKINHRYPSGLSEHFQHIPRNLIAVYIMRLPNI